MMNPASITIASLASVLDTEDQLLSSLKSFTEAKAVAWYYDEIVFLRCNNNAWFPHQPVWEKLVRLRVFNMEKELHIWRSNGQLKGRLRVDGTGEDSRAVDARLVLNGTSLQPTGDGITSSERNGTHYVLPYPELQKEIGVNKRVLLLTRNYIGYADNGQAGYTDSRFIDFIIK